MDLTLNDFRAVLGKVNDGNVIIVNDAQKGIGLKKVNYGTFKKEVTHTTAQQNREMRQAFVDVLTNSPEGRRAGEDFIRAIRTRLGLPDGQLSDQPLQRREIKAVLEELDRSHYGDIGLINDEMHELREMGALDSGGVNQLAYDVRATLTTACMKYFADAKSMLSAFGSREGINGFTHAQLKRFLADNEERIKLMTFDHVLWQQVDAKKKGGLGAGPMDCTYLPPRHKPEDKPIPALYRPSYQKSLLKSVITSIMQSYADHKEIETKGHAFVRCAKAPELLKPADIMKPVVERAEKLFDLIFPHVDGSIVKSLQNRQIRDLLTTVFSNVCTVVAQKQNNQDPAQRQKNALGVIREKFPGAARILNLSTDVFEGLSPALKVIVGARLNRDILTALRADGHENVFPADYVMYALSTAVENLTKEIAPQKLIGAIATQVNEGINLPPDKLAETVKQIVPAFTDNASLRTVQTLVLRNIVMGRPVDSELGGLPAMTTLTAAIRDEIQTIVDGPEKRAAAFLAIGKAPTTVCYLAKGLRRRIGGTDLEPIEEPINERATLIAGKIAFLRTVMGRTNPELTEVFLPSNEATANRFVFHGEMEDFDHPEKWCKEDRERMAKIDKLCNRYTIADLNDTVSYFKTTLDQGDLSGALYLLGRDKYFRMETGNKIGAFNMTQILGQLGLGYILTLNDDPKKAPVSGDFRNYYNTLVAMLTPMLAAESQQFPPYGEETVAQGIKTINGLIGMDPQGRFFGTFGSMSTVEFLGFLEDCGLTIKDLSTTDGLARFFVAARAKHDADNAAVGVAEWFVRITGIDLKTMTADQAPAAMAKLMSAEKAGLKDPINAFTADQKKVVSFIEGKVKAEEFDLNAATMGDVVMALRDVVGKRVAEASCAVNGLKVTFSYGRRGSLKVTVMGSDGKAYPIPANRTPAALLAVLETKIANHPNEYGDLAATILPGMENDMPQGMTVSRTRELCTKILVAKLGVPSVSFAAMDLEALVTAAKGAVAGTYTKADVPTVPSTNYNAADVAAVQRSYVKATEAERQLVKMPADLETRTENERATQPPPANVVHNCLSELVMNLDTSQYDADTAKGVTPGTRLSNVLKAYEPELKFILEDIPTYTKTLPSAVRKDVEDLLGKIRTADRRNLAALSKIEEEIGAFIEKTMRAMQTKITALFEGRIGGQENGDIWKKSLEDLTNVNGLDPNSPNGKFVLDVLKNYFVEAAPTEKRAMLSAYLRNSFTTVDKDGQIEDPSFGCEAGELMKGAGPIFQKMLQGLPIESFGPETQNALKDMKSRLSPIPDPIIRAQLLDLIKSSNGEVISIEVKGSIGCATVGQALLCHIVTKEHPYTGEDVVIKLRRPNVQTAALREYEVIKAIAIRSGKGMDVTFEGQFASILKELDFTLEAENVDVAKVHYDRTQNGDGVIRSMGRFTSAPATMDAVILERVSGRTLDGEMTGTENVLRELKGQFESKVAVAPGSNEVRTVFRGKSVGDVQIVRARLSDQYQKLAEERAKLNKLVTVWMNEALFGTGFFHGDLHAGNVMVDKKEMTFIDFGNVTRLSADERKWITKLFLVAGYSFNNTKPGEEFVAALGNLLTGEAKATLEREKVALTAEIDGILRLGQYDKLASKVFAALAAAQRHKIALPEGVGAFLQSISRLKGAMSQIDHLMDDCELSMRRIELGSTVIDDLHLENFSGKIPLADDLVAFLTKVGCNAEKGLDRGAIKNFGKAVRAFSKHIANDDPANDNVFNVQGVTNDKLFGESGFDVSLFRAFAQTFKGVRFHFSDGDRELEDVAKMMTDCDALEKLATAPKSEETEQDIHKLKFSLRYATYSIFNWFYQQYEPKLPNHREFDSFESIIADCFSEHLSDIRQTFDGGVQTSFAYGTLMIDPKIKNQRALASAAAKEANDDLPEEERLGDARMRQLDAIAIDFRFPGGPAATDDLKKESLKDILEVNIKMVRERLGYAEGERINPAELKYLATFFRTIHQAKDTRGFFSRGAAMTGAVATMLMHRNDPTFDILTVYSLDTDDNIPMTRALRKISEQDLVNLQLSEEAAEFARLIRA